MSVRADRPQLTVLRSLDMPMERVRWWPFLRPLVWFGVRFLVMLAVLVLATPRWIGFWGLVFAAYELAALPLGWQLYPSVIGPMTEEHWSSNRCAWAIVLGPAAPYVYAFRLLRSVWRCWRMRG